MRLPVVRGIIDRRILVNYRVDPAILERVLPDPFRPQIVGGFGAAGICLIRLKHVRPRFVPRFLGMSSENAAHRIAVEWDDQGETKQAVYVPRRDTNSCFNTLVGGRLFPGVHQSATFDTDETDDHYRLDIQSKDGEVTLHVDATTNDSLHNSMPAESMFGSLDEASAFFEKDSVGYSATRGHDQFDGLELCSKNWTVSPLNVHAVRSSYFEDEAIFPRGSATFDHALLMREIHHEWHSLTSLPACPCEEEVAAT